MGETENREGQEGMVLVLVLLVLVAAVIIGTTVMRSSTIETKIVGNERIYKQDFYLAESAGNYTIANFDIFASSVAMNMNTTYDFSSQLPGDSIISNAAISLELFREGTSQVGSGSSATQLITRYYRAVSTLNNQTIEIGVWKNFPEQ
ncbi:MAG: hypothetical protein J7L53_01660 [Deltaproteobacteria bacterium]|nr:hypothetical protein [Deltaproteobacteria bacterium]